MKIGFKAVQIAIAGFVIPYMAVYDPALMLQGDPSLARGRLHRRQGGAGHRALGRRSHRLPVVAARPRRAASSRRPPPGCWSPRLPVTDELGFALAAVFGAWHCFRSRRR